MKKIVITQSNYIPWKGYFDGIHIADEFVLYDDMQYTKRDWRNRNKIKTAQGAQWLSIAVEVKGKFFQKINETKISEPGWNKSHWDTIKHNYSKAPAFNEIKDFIEPLYMTATFEYLSEINYHFLRGISDFLGINTPIRFSSEFEMIGDRTEKLMNICKALNGTDYYSGPSAKEYMEESIFEKENIQVHYFDNSGYKEYPQLFPPFDHAVSIIDLLMNEGKNSTKFLKSFEGNG
ncbi:MAG: hypothetical protein JWO06_2709 [Bacteroidota bacterium]|nr:hypothetical protein [Bacteroidota bacterium]